MLRSDRQSYLKSRRRVIRRELSGLNAKEPRDKPLQRIVDRNRDAPTHSWAHALTRLGPIFVRCGQHLASRIDLFGDELRQAFANIEYQTPTPFKHLLERLHREFGGSLERRFRRIDEHPLEVRALFQIHRAWLIDGTAVHLKVSRTALNPLLDNDIDLLPALAPTLSSWAACPQGRLQVNQAIAHTQLLLRSELDLTEEAKLHHHLASSAESTTRVSEIYTHLSTRHVLTTRVDKQIPLIDLYPTRTRDSEGTKEREDFAILLCTTWLQQVFSQHYLPLCATPEQVVLSEQEIRFRNNGLRPLNLDEREKLWQYLEASAAHAPEQIATKLLELCGSKSKYCRGDRGFDTLVQQLRQVQPMRTTECRADFLPDYLGLHWRVMANLGYSLPPNIVDFFIAVNKLQQSVYFLRPGIDPFRKAFEDLRFSNELAHWKERLKPDHLIHDLHQLQTLIRVLPPAVESFLKDLERSQTPNLNSTSRENETKVRASEHSFPILMLAWLTTAAMIVMPIVMPNLEGWGETVETIALLLLGGSIMRDIGEG